MAYQGSDGQWYTDEGIPLSQSAEGQVGSYLPGYSPEAAYGQDDTYRQYINGTIPGADGGGDSFWTDPANQPPPPGHTTDPGDDNTDDAYTFTPPWAGYGQPAGPFADYAALARPDYLQGEYKPPSTFTPTQWTEQFNPLTMQQVQQTPGFQTGLDARRLTGERSAAARGTILSGGTQVALQRDAQNYGENFYGVENGRAYDQYLQRYKQSQDANTLGLQASVATNTAGAQARSLNENAFQNDERNNEADFGFRYRNYRDTLSDLRGTEEDYYRRSIFDPTNWKLQKTIAAG